jgi:D-beta-D-heptose 7-phosphate kinase/D-beta-D-heptose 1-phosphate adenosyltransferase
MRGAVIGRGARGSDATPAGNGNGLRDKLGFLRAVSPLAAAHSGFSCEHGALLIPAILTLDEAILRFGRGKRNGRCVVFTNGCFDLLHPGHIQSLEYARELGDILIVGLNSDNSVRQLKGEGRPLLPERERAEILAAMEGVDAVIIFDDLTPQRVIARLLPDVLVKGGDWAGDCIVGREEVEAAGGRVVSAPVVPGYSTTEIVRKIHDSVVVTRGDS